MTQEEMEYQIEQMRIKLNELSATVSKLDDAISYLARQEATRVLEKARASAGKDEQQLRIVDALQASLLD